jgi:hypothetical protein
MEAHLTERMQQHYSTANAAEQRDALAKVIRLFDPKPSSSRARAQGKPRGARARSPSAGGH